MLGPSCPLPLSSPLTSFLFCLLTSYPGILLPTYLWTLLSTHRLPLASLACLWCKCPRPLCGPTLPTTQASAAALQDLRPPSPQLVSSKDLAGMVYIKRLRALLLSTCCTLCNAQSQSMVYKQVAVQLKKWTRPVSYVRGCCYVYFSVCVG